MSHSLMVEKSIQPQLVKSFRKTKIAIKFRATIDTSSGDHLMILCNVYSMSKAKNEIT